MSDLEIDNLIATVDHFQEIVLDLYKNRIIYDEFLHNVIKFSIGNNNDLFLFVHYNYVISQLLYLRKLFDTDNDVYRFTDITANVSNELKNTRKDLQKRWQEKNFNSLLNKHLAHSVKTEIKSDISISLIEMANFIDDFKTFFENVISELSTKNSGFDSFLKNSDGYISDRREEVNQFFEAINKPPRARDITLVILLNKSSWHMDALKAVKSLGLPDWAIGAGFVRNPVWDWLHGYNKPTPLSDIDVAYFDPNDLSKETEKLYETKLKAVMNENWSVKNQARMSAVDHFPREYTSTADALSHWPETATAIGVRLDANDNVELIAPHGTDDLMSLTLRMTPDFPGGHEYFLKRIEKKQWLTKWPRLKII